MTISRFSLIELVVVTAIILLIAGVAVGRLGKAPQFASQEKAIREIERFFAQSTHAAAMRGKPLIAEYQPEDCCFRLEEDLYICQIPKEFAPGFAGKVEFLCRPDGTVSGPELKFETSRFRFSPLTGILREVQP